jgi:ABC-type Fe3+-hydroxamate transport system substrate-binding protein
MFWLVTQRNRQAVDASGVGRQTEPQEIIGPVETSTPDMPPRQFGMQLQSMGMPDQPKQRRTSGNRKPGLHKKLVELAGLLLKGVARAIGPCLIAERGGADSQRRPGTRPWTQGRGDTADEIRRTQGEAEPQARKAVEFPKRAQDQYGQIGAQCDCTNCRIDIGKRLIDDQPSAATYELRRNPRQRSAVSDAPVRIIGIDDDRMNRGLGASIKPVDRDHPMAGVAPGECMFAIGWSDDCYRPRRREIWQQLDQCLGSGGGSNFRTRRCAISLARDRQQRIHFGARWQTLPYAFGQMPRNWPRPGIDPGRQIQPTPGRAAILRDCLSEVATMLHAGFMPSSASKRERAQSAFLATAILASIGLQSAYAAELPRIASINLCTDQLLATLADPAQILGLSPYARDPARSWDAAKAAQFPKLSGEAEDVLILKPDIVVAGRFTKRATRELLKEKGLRVVEFDAARSLDDVKKQIRQMGDLVQHPDRAAAEINRLDAAVAHAREVASRKPYRVLALSRRGWVSGGDSLTSSLLATAGLSNAAADLGYRLGGFASLEAIVSLKPDFLLVSEAGEFAEDEGRAFMLHPALERFYPASKRLVIPEKLTVCGGPKLSEALDRLASELERVAH